MTSSRLLAVACLSLLCGVALPASAQLAPETAAAIDAIANQALADSKDPSVSVAVVKDGKLVYAKAYGLARIDPAVAATPQMRYKIGSNSKQFLAVAMLMLVDESKLSLDDKVARFFPELTQAKDISVRQLLSHTSGYSDFYALDYLPPTMRRATTPGAIMQQWAGAPLNFSPGARWEYSNTNYTIAGRIVEKLSGQPLDQFIRQRITGKLKMDSAVDLDHVAFGPGDPTGYESYALGPNRPVMAEGKYWLFGAGQLAMTASDLARWDIALMSKRFLSPAAYQALATPTRLADGTASDYSLGIFIGTTSAGQTRWSHGGEVTGFISANDLYPDQGLAIVALTNGHGSASGRVASGIAKLLLPPAPVAASAPAPAQATPAPAPEDAASRAAAERVRSLFTSLQEGHPDRSIMHPDLQAYFTEQAVADFAASLKPLGPIETVVQRRQEERGGMMARNYLVKTATRELRVSTFFMPDGAISQFLVFPR